jgi:hypothetical protein
MTMISPTGAQEMLAISIDAAGTAKLALRDRLLVILAQKGRSI